jgi:hypothetical protein
MCWMSWVFITEHMTYNNKEFRHNNITLQHVDNIKNLNNQEFQYTTSKS